MPLARKKMCRERNEMRLARNERGVGNVGLSDIVWAFHQLPSRLINISLYTVF